MPEGLIPALTFAAAIGSGLAAGVFLAFSSFVMAALARISPESGIAAMNAINVTVINPVFMGVFLGTGAVCLALAAAALWGGAPLLLTASLVYALGAVGVTLAFNVPLNDLLAAVRPGTPEAADLWSRYLTDWTFWNHARTAASLLAAILFTAVLFRRAGP